MQLELLPLLVWTFPAESRDQTEAEILVQDLFLLAFLCGKVACCPEGERAIEDGYIADSWFVTSFYFSTGNEKEIQKRHRQWRSLNFDFQLNLFSCSDR